MALLDDVKVSLRLSTDAMDSEVSMLIAAAKADMKRVGVPEKMLVDDSMDPYLTCAFTLFDPARCGYPNSVGARFDESYRQIVRDLLNSPTTYGGEGA